MTDTSSWRTHEDPEYLAQFGMSEGHLVFFQPIGDRDGPASFVIVVNIPETSSRDVKRAMAQARATKARVAFSCDTRQQANEIAERAAPLLPKHRRIAYERAAAGAWNDRWH